MDFDLTGRFKTARHIRLNRSKSLYIRYLIYVYARYGRILPVNTNEAEDVRTVCRNLHIIDRNKNSSEPVKIDIADCGAAYRFFAALLSVMPGKWFLTGNARLMERPVTPLILSLRKAGADLRQEKEGILITGNVIHIPGMQIDCTLSSQFASALLLIAPFTGLQKLNIIPAPPPSSSYIEMTRRVIEEIDHKPAFSVTDIETDWSAAAFWYALATLKGEGIYHLEGLKLKSLQPDSVISGWFRDFGINSVQTPKGVTIEKINDGIISQPVIFDLYSNPDLAPVLAVFAVLYPCETILTGLQNLNNKESKRLDILMQELSRFARIEKPDNGTLHIIPGERVNGMELAFKSHGDHRFIMAFVLFALFNRVTLDEVESVKKSYPGFPDDLSGLIVKGS